MKEAIKNCTNVSEVQITPIQPRDGLIAFASCIVDHKLFLGSIGVFTTLSGGYRITFPTKKVGKDGFSVSIFNPINKEACEAITEVILNKVTNLFNQSNYELT